MFASLSYSLFVKCQRAVLECLGGAVDNEVPAVHSGRELPLISASLRRKLGAIVRFCSSVLCCSRMMKNDEPYIVTSKLHLLDEKIVLHVDKIFCSTRFSGFQGLPAETLTFSILLKVYRGLIGLYSRPNRSIFIRQHANVSAPGALLNIWDSYIYINYKFIPYNVRLGSSDRLAATKAEKTDGVPFPLPVDLGGAGTLPGCAELSGDTNSCQFDQILTQKN